MGTFAVYTFCAGVLLLFGYAAYKAFLAGERMPSFNRAVLLCLYAAAFLLPLARNLNFVGEAAGAIAVGVPEADVIAGAADTATEFPFVGVLLWIYSAGVAAVLFWSVITAVRLAVLVAGGKKEKCGGYTLVLISDRAFAPFSWGRYIVIAENESAEFSDMIIRHEQSHIRLRHFYDLILGQAVCAVLWYNPASWLMLAELKAVHEYQADRAVLDSGTEVYSYQILLIEKATGTAFGVLANSLNNSKLKKRIAMMCKPSSRPVRRLRALAAVPALALALSFLGIPAVSQAMTDISSAEIAAEAAAPAQPAAVGKTESAEPRPDVLPQYPGGQMAMLKALMDEVKYPEKAIKDSVQGKVAVRFVVNAEGRLSDYSIEKSVSPELDAEALRAVKTLDIKWQPATADGKPVSCSFVLPVDFRLK